MDHCAIDLGGKKSQVCLRSPDGRVLLEARYDTLSLPDFLRQLPHSRVILETAAEAFRIADAAKTAGHEVRVVPATLVRTLGVGARKTKTDRRDAQMLSEVSCRIDLPSVHIPSARSREWKTICGMHDALISSRTKLINNLRGWLRGQGLRLSSGSAETLAGRIAEIESLPEYVASQVAMLALLTEKIRTSEQRIEDLAKSDELCKRLMTVPGIGPSTLTRSKRTWGLRLARAPARSDNSGSASPRQGPRPCGGCWCRRHGRCRYAAAAWQRGRYNSGQQRLQSAEASASPRSPSHESWRESFTLFGATERLTSCARSRGALLQDI